MEPPPWLFERRLQHLKLVYKLNWALLRKLQQSRPHKVTAGNLIFDPEKKNQKCYFWYFKLDNEFEFLNF